eukprot:6200081-Pleurochrysis_carterae.AAC.1
MAPINTSYRAIFVSVPAATGALPCQLMPPAHRGTGDAFHASLSCGPQLFAVAVAAVPGAVLAPVAAAAAAAAACAWLSVRFFCFFLMPIRPAATCTVKRVPHTGQDGSRA